MTIIKMYLYFMKLLYNIWSPHLWFSLVSLSMAYPKEPSDLLKKQYYSYIHNLPLFYPYDKFDTHFTKLLKEYPLTPYLDNNVSFLKWINYIRNKTDEIYNVETKNLNQTIRDYYNHYETIDEEKKNISLKNYFTICIILTIAIVYLKK
jgi:hypothetical protein